MARLRNCDPVPQVRVHEEYELQAETTQSIGQASVLHCRLASNVGQISPPYAAARVTVRVLFEIPLPQVTEQVLHTFH